MAFLADSGVPCPPRSPRPVPLIERTEWLVLAVLATLLASLGFLQGSIAGTERTALQDMAVCEQRTLASPNLFFLAFH